MRPAERRAVRTGGDVHRHAGGTPGTSAAEAWEPGTQGRAGLYAASGAPLVIRQCAARKPYGSGTLVPGAKTKP